MILWLVNYIVTYDEDGTENKEAKVCYKRKPMVHNTTFIRDWVYSLKIIFNSLFVTKNLNLFSNFACY